jgi:multidrug efflux pump subunit AcrA (membrane-fusion protein)
MRLALVFGSLLLTVIAQAANDKTPIVFTQVAKKTEIFDQLTYPAKINPSVQAKILAESDGVVTKILAPLGSKVSRKSGVVQVQNMEPGYSFAPMRMASPVAGIVSQIKVSVGSQVAKGQEIATVIEPTSLRIEVEIAAGDMVHVKNGLKGELYLPGQDKPTSVEVLGVSPLVDPATGTATAELKVVGKNSVLIPGTLGQVRFKANIRNGIELPDNAIVYKGDDTNVRLVLSGKAKLNAVKLGPKRQGKFEILSGVKEGDEVIERTSTFVADGDEVKVQPKEATK